MKLILKSSPLLIVGLAMILVMSSCQSKNNETEYLHLDKEKPYFEVH